MNWYLKCFKQYTDFSGRARRKEFWMFALCNWVIYIALVVVDALVGWFSTEASVGVLSGLYSLFVLIPGLAVFVRRMHDIGKSGWNILFGLIPLVGVIILLVFECTEGDRLTNAYGPNPKAYEA